MNSMGDSVVYHVETHAIWYLGITDQYTKAKLTDSLWQSLGTEGTEEEYNLN